MEAARGIVATIDGTGALGVAAVDGDDDVAGHGELGDGKIEIGDRVELVRAPHAGDSDRPGPDRHRRHVVGLEPRLLQNEVQERLRRRARAGDADLLALEVGR